VNGILKNTSLINSQASNTFGNDKKWIYKINDHSHLSFSLFSCASCV